MLNEMRQVIHGREHQVWYVLLHTVRQRVFVRLATEAMSQTPAPSCKKACDDSFSMTGRKEVEPSVLIPAQQSDMSNTVIVVGSISLMLVASILMHVGDAYFLRDFAAGNVQRSIWWLVLQALSIPIFAISSYGLYVVKPTWWFVELPYWVMALVLSLVLFRQVLHVAISWREVVSGILFIVICLLLYDT